MTLPPPSAKPEHNRHDGGLTPSLKAEFMLRQNLDRLLDSSAVLALLLHGLADIDQPRQNHRPDAVDLAALGLELPRQLPGVGLGDAQLLDLLQRVALRRLQISFGAVDDVQPV